MPDYIEVPFTVEPEDLATLAFDYLQTRIAGWAPANGNLDTIMAESFAQISSEMMDVASAVPQTIFRYFGKVVNTLPIDATAAVSSVTFTVVNNAGYTIPDETQIGFRISGDELIAFQTVGQLTIPSGSTTGVIQIQAIEEGAAGSGLGGPGVAMEMIDPLSFVSSVVLTATTTGGVDAETDQEYLDRLASRLTLIAPRPIIPNDFALFARDIAGVHRALAIDGYNPANQTFNNERMVTVAIMDENGNALDPTVKQQVDDYLQTHREVNFLVSVIDPTPTTVDVNYTVMAMPSFVASDLLADINEALSSYLNPATWGQLEGAGDTSTFSWYQETNVRYLELAQVINSVVGVNYIMALTFRKGTDAFASTDITLSGVAPVADAGAINGTVNTP